MEWISEKENSDFILKPHATTDIISLIKDLGGIFLTQRKEPGANFILFLHTWKSKKRFPMSKNNI